MTTTLASHRPAKQSLLRLGAGWLFTAASLLAPASIAQEDRMPGYYPTGEEVELLGGESRELYRRHNGGVMIGGPDAGSLTASGLWHQDPDPTDSFYERNASLFNPLDSTLGILAPREILLMERGEATNGHLYGYLDPGFPFTRDFNPDLATFKLGPVYLDLLSLSGTLLYSDYSGSGIAGESDGWLSSINLDFRGVGRITPHLYLTLSGSIYFLPLDGEIGFYFADGHQSFLRLAYERSIGPWEFVLFDEFTAHHPLSDIFDEIEHDEIDRAGRYRFGRLDVRRSADYFDSDALYFINRLGAAANGPLGDDFTGWASFEHFDYWDTLDFDHLRNWDRLKTRVDYNGFDWPVIPYAEYNLTALDDWDILHHSFWLGARARLTENLRVDGRFGYFMTDGGSQDTEQPIGEIGIVHELAEGTTHSLFAGVRNHMWENAEDLLARYARYAINHRFGSRLRGSAFVQYQDLENLDGSYDDRSGWSTGANLTAYISEYTRAEVGAQYDTWDHTGSTLTDRDRFLFRTSINQRLLPYMYGRLLYQYEDYSTSGVQGYNEHLYMLTLRYLF